MAVAINFRLVSGEIVYVQDCGRVEGIDPRTEFLDRVDPIRDRLSGIEKYVCLEKRDRRGCSTTMNLVKRECNPPPVSGDDRDAAVVLFHLRYSAFPKAVVLTHPIS